MYLFVGDVEFSAPDGGDGDPRVAVPATQFLSIMPASLSAPLASEIAGCPQLTPYRLSDCVYGLRSLHGPQQQVEVGEDPPTPECLEGIAPVAVWDGRQRRLTCYAHPLGAGTFYYGWRDGCLIVSSKIHTIGRLTGRREPNRQAVADCLLQRDVFPVDLQSTLVDGITQIPPGALLQLSASGCNLRYYWRPIDDPHVERLAYEEACDYVDAAMVQSVASSMAGGRVAALVSGGLDSSTVAAIAHRHGGAIRLLNAGNRLESPEERALQRKLASHLGATIDTPASISPKMDLDALRSLNAVKSVPSGGLFCGIYRDTLLDLSASNVTVLLTGDGGDEVFTSSANILADLLHRRAWTSSLQAIGYLTSRRTDAWSGWIAWRYGILPLATLGSSRSCRLADHHQSSIQLADPGRRHYLMQLYGPFYEEIAGVPVRVAQDMRRRWNEGWSFATYNNYRRVLRIPSYAPAWVNGSEGPPVRVANPIASVDVFRAAMSLRLEERITTAIGFDPKRLLRSVAYKYLPIAVAGHRKINTNTLLLKTAGDIRDQVAAAFQSRALERLGVIVDHRLQTASSAAGPYELFWLLLLNLAIWFEEYERLTRNR